MPQDSDPNTSASPESTPHHSSKDRTQPILQGNVSREMLIQLMASAPVAIVMVNAHGQILYANTKLCEMFGYGEAELINQPIEILVPERFRQDHVHHRLDYRQHPRTRPMGSGLDLVGRHRDGAEFPIEAGLSYVNLDDELIVMGSISDLTRRKQTEEMLEQRVEERTREIDRRRKVADGLRDILTVLNSNQSLAETLNYIAAQACRLLYANASAIGRRDDERGEMMIQASYGLPDIAASVQPEPARTSGQSSQNDLEMQLTLGNQPGQGDTPRPDASGEGTGTGVNQVSYDLLYRYESNYQAVLSVPLLLQHETYGSLMLYYDEPRQFSAEEIELANTVGDQTALAIENARLRTQVERTAVAAERSRIARDLHDSVTQTLFSASLIAEVVPRLWENRPDEAVRRLEELRQLTRGALAEMRTLLLELRPATLTEVELAELLRQLTEAITGRSRIPIDLEIETDHKLPPDIKIAFYHIAQEALNNVAKHARATHAAVRLSQEDGVTSLSVSDNGCGFVIERVTPEHLGLSIMHERAEAIGARLDVSSRLENGTEIVVSWAPAG